MGEPINVPLLNLCSQNQPLAEELKAAFARVLDSSQFILGAELARFEERAAESVGAQHAIGVSSGTDALLLSLMTLGIGPGDEVLCPSFTFFATAGAIARTGAIPVFVDSLDADFSIDATDAKRRVTDKTKAIIPVHLFGHAADMDGVQRLAKARGLVMLEDAAQSMGATHGDRQVGTMGDLGAFSFFPSKNLGGFGDGGMITTDDDALAKRTRILRVHGGAPKYYHKVVGGNFRMDPLHAALLGVKLDHFPDYLAKRRANAAQHLERLAQCEHVAEGRLVLPSEIDGRSHTWNQFTLRVSNGRRDALQAHLTENHIGSAIYYPVPLHLQECFAHLPSFRESLPVCEKMAGEVLSIPVYPEMSEEQLDHVADTLANAPL
ncbi:MAG: DegT/DnrJ/EryC1/StrS family aminotransferase [Verrucomicrobiota bacterium]|jgi:dTDP-4-amino-4,6-dideoxygalactose transaminase|nr:DegT/DnrJ/EryC1/StrS family aminotransferase [Verrucomicrobiota bacterium]MDP7049096.1 DegT/DnrJ/EryC1/StrS family aminotransferase [Verrucomicrobiota bacterium]